MLAVQAGLLDGLTVPLVATFRQGLGEAIDQGAGDVVRQINETGGLDAAGRQELLQLLEGYAQKITPPALATSSSKSAPT